MNVYSTPVQELDIYKNNRIFIKREDMIPYSFGGNKVRKAVKFFEEIDRNGYDCVVTYGSSSSNHCRAVANMAAKRHMKCYIICPEEASKVTNNSRLINMLGAETYVVSVENVHDSIENNLESLRSEGMNPYFIQGGGHGNLGTQAYVECYDEIACQEKELGIHFDYIFFASGTGTTQAGLVCGQMIYNDERKIVGISIARKKPRGSQIVKDSIIDYLDEKCVEYTSDKIDENLIFIDKYTSTGYGNADEEINHVVNSMFINHGIPMDLTYTGKAYNGMLKYIVENNIENKNVLFIHTGGTPLFFDSIE